MRIIEPLKVSAQPAKRRSVKIPFVAASLTLVLMTGLVVYLLRFQQLPDVVPMIEAVDVIPANSVELPWPGEGMAAVAAEGYGLLAYSGDPDKQVPIASMTKVFTALAVLRENPLVPGEQGPVITLTSQDVALYNTYIAKLGAVVPVRAGQQLTQYQALQALLLPSANNIADTLAIWAFGSVEEYTEYANSMVKEMGLGRTAISDASGFSPQTVSTMEDLLLAAEIALNNPVIAEIVQQREAVLPESGVIRNTNLLLEEEQVIGLKTGMTDEAGVCLLFAGEYQIADAEPIVVYGVVVGQPTRPASFRHAGALLKRSSEQFEYVQVASVNSVVGRYDVPWGVNPEIITGQNLAIQKWSGAEVQSIATAEPVSAGTQPGAAVGRMTAEAGEASISVPLELASEVPHPSLWWRFKYLIGLE